MRGFVVMAGGALLLLSSLAHGLMGGPMMRSELEAAGVGPDLIAGQSAGWYFGSVAMAVFGFAVLVAGTCMRRGDRSGLVFARLIGAGYALFGLVAFLMLDFNTHFLGFIVIGCLASLPTLGTSVAAQSLALPVSQEAEAGRSRI